MGVLDLSEAELRTVSPQNLESVLDTLGWQRMGGSPAVSHQWVRETDGDLISVVVPLDSSFEDYPLRISEAMRRIAAYYPYDAASLLLEVAMPGVDEMTNRKDEPTVHGSIAWKSAERQIAGFRETLTAAAKATESRERRYARSRKKIAQDFLSQLRMGQTRVGSFVITALSPIGPLETKNKGNVYTEHLGYTGRNVVEAMVGGLQALRTAADEFKSSGTEYIFDDTVNLGVSLDLVRGMQKNLGSSAGSETVIAWSPRLQNKTKQREVSVDFDPSHIPAFKAAVRRLQDAATSQRRTVLGRVTNLERRQPGDPGVITVEVLSGSDALTVHIELQATYDAAVDSHKRGDLLSVTGIERQEKTQFWIREPEELRFTDSRGQSRQISLGEPTHNG